MKNKLIISISLIFFLFISIIPQVFCGTWVGDFEKGDFSRWDHVGSGFSINSDVVHSGLYSAKWDWSSSSLVWLIKTFEGVNSNTKLTFFMRFEKLSFENNKLDWLITLYNDDTGIGVHPLRIEVQEVDPYEWVYTGMTWEIPSGYGDWGIYGDTPVNLDHWYNVTVVSNTTLDSEDIKVYIDGSLDCNAPTVEGWLKSLDAFRMGGRVTGGGSTILYIDDVTFTSDPIEDDKYERDTVSWSWVKWVLLFISMLTIVIIAIYIKKSV